MAWLALDTSTPYLSLALLERQGQAWHTLCEAQVGPHVKQSELLPGTVASFLAGLAPTSLQGLIVGLGPGSFTGLRVGLAFAKGLAYATRRPLVGASSLAAVAWDGPAGRPLAALALSRKGELYVGLYRREEGIDAGLQRLEPEVALPLRGCADRLGALPGVLALGPAVAAHREALLGLGVPLDALQDGPACPRAQSLAPLVAVPDAYDFRQLAALEPHYIGTSGAERNSPTGLKG